MTPIRGFFKRLLSTPDSAAGDTASPERDRRTSTATADSDTRPDGDEQSKRRRRGRRGGRGRNRGSGDGSSTQATQQSSNRNSEAAAATSERQETRQQSRQDQPKQQRSSGNQSQSRQSGRNGGKSGNNQDSDKREYRWGRRVPDEEAKELVEQRMQQSQRRRRTNRRTDLDAPLPEDIAFRAAAEGGDRSILPARRRRPEGLRDTERVIIAGPRTLSGWSHWGTMPSLATPTPQITVADPEGAQPDPTELDASSDAPEHPSARVAPPVPPAVDDDIDNTAADLEDSADTEADEDANETTEEATSRPRRRGRRGGRGRSRGSDAEALAAASSDETGDAEDGEAEAEEAPEAAPERAPRRPAAVRPLPSGDFPPAFVALGISARNLEAVSRLGFADPTPIQERAIPTLLNGLDVVGVAQTGSGKTMAFGLPMMERLDASVAEVQAIVLVPTRELAQQVLDVLEDLGKTWGIEAIGLLGGRRLDADFRALQGRPHVVVGTPGRVIDHLNRGTLSLRHVRYAVLDEADQMLDIGFLPDIRRILSRTPKRRQTALFSATMPGSIRRLVWQFMDDPETVTVDPELSTVDSIEQTYVEVAQRDKVRGLRELIDRELKGRTLVFSRTKRGVDHLEHQLSNDGVRVGALHGDMDQRRRDRVVQDFREGKLDILVATNVAARGLDIPEITHVVNYDVPQNVEEYVHRIGRTGRAGRTGKAITFVCEWDMQEFDTILQEFRDHVSKEELDLYAR